MTTRSRGRLPGALLALGLLAPGCGGTAAQPPTAPDGAEPGISAARPGQAAPPAVAPLRRRVTPDVLVFSPQPLPDRVVGRLRTLSPGGLTTFRSGRALLEGKRADVSGVDPSSFRAFAPPGTAESDPVWQGVARNELVVSHDYAKARRIKLGSTVRVGPHKLRVAALATTLPDVDVVVSFAVADGLGLPPANAALLTAGKGDPAALAASARKAAGKARIHLLTQPKTPYALLTGAGAAKAFGAFSYRWYDDGTIEPDARWVATNIVSASVPVIGTVRCHRLIVPQLRSALREVQAAGLAPTIRSFDGCYVPRFIERDPTRAVSLHTWGIAFDLNASTNMPGARGDMNPRVVSIMKRWGFRWGGDWSHPDPMHFELGALITS